MKVDFQNSNRKPLRFLSLTVMFGVGSYVIFTLLRVFFSYQSSEMTPAKELSILKEIAKESTYPSSPFVDYFKETPFGGGSRKILYIKGTKGEDVYIMLDAVTEPKIKIIPENTNFFITRKQIENIEKEYSISQTAKKYLEAHIIK